MLRIPLLLLLGAVAALPGDEPSSGFQRFVDRQEQAAKAAARSKDWPAAMAAWNELLELDPRSIAGLQGLADAAQAAGDADAEVLARTELVTALARAVALGQREHERTLAKAQERLAAIDPSAGRADELLADYSEAQRQLALDYESEGFPANAITAWGRRARLAAPGSAERNEAAAAIDRLRRTSASYVAMHFDPGIVVEARDQAWIAEQDKRSVKFSSALKVETPHYRIKTNAGWRMLQAAASTMELVHAFYREIWGVIPDPPPARPAEGLREVHIPLLDVNIFSTRDEYIHRTGTGKSDWSGGHYNGSEVNTYDQGEAGGKNGIPATMGVLFHEASHQFMRECVGGVPSFVNEGVASLFEGIELLPNGDVQRDLPVLHYLQPLAQALQDGSARSLRSVFAANANEPDLYKYRWSVFYFVRMYVDENGRYPFRERLVEYIYDFKRGELGDLAGHFEAFFLKPADLPGLRTFEEFEKTWREWILGLELELKQSDKRLVAFRDKAKAAVRYEPGKALEFSDRALDLDPDDLDSLHTAAQASGLLEQKDRELATWRRVLELCDEDDPRRAEGTARCAALDPLGSRFTDARRALAGGMAALAMEHDAAGRPLMAMFTGRRVLRIDPFEPAARALVTRLERDTGRSVVRWQRLYNGFDLGGWYGVEGGEAFAADGPAISCDPRRIAKAAAAAGKDGAAAPAPVDDGAITYQALLCTRQVSGDWSYEAKLTTQKEWQIAGLIFGAKDATHYEAIVLRRGTDGMNRVDFGTFADGAWTFPRTDGALKASYDPAAGVVMRIDVRGRRVSVSLDGQPLQPIVGKKSVTSIKYPQAALRGDIGLLGSRGVTSYTGVRLQAGDER